MEFLRFIFSSVWVWLGFNITLLVIVNGLAESVRACKRNRKVTAYRIGQRWQVMVEGASRDDVRTAIMSTAYNSMDNAEDGEDAGEGNKCTGR